MKLNILIIVVFCLFSKSNLYAQSTSVIIARKNNACGKRTDIGYTISNDAAADPQKEQEKMLEKYPDLRAIELINLDENKMGLSILLIISATTETDNCEQRITYGVGYAKTRENALKKAISWINRMNNDWSEAKNGYQVVLEKDYTKKAEEKLSTFSEKTVVTGF